MTTATRVNMTLIEFMAPFADRVDRENRIIKGVKVIGLQSGNSVRVTGIDSNETYEYTPQALINAIPLYEKAVVNLDHPDFEMDSSGKRHAVSATKTSQRFGRLINVQFIEGQGLFADLEYLASNPLSEMILEAAERMPETLALSHNARGDISRQDGKFVVDEIGEVRSVDLIAEKPGTTHSLFEALNDKETEMPNTLLTSPEDNLQIQATKEGEETRLVPELDTDDPAAEARIMEQDEEEEEVIAEADVAADPAAMLDSAFRAAINAMMDDDTLTDDALKTKLNDLVSKRSETMAVIAGEDSEVVEQEEGSEKKDEEDTAIAESMAVVVNKYREVKRENETMKKEFKARELLESKNIKPTEAQIKAMAALDNKKLQVELMESFTPRVKRPAVTKNRGLHKTVSVDGYPEDFESLMSILKD